MDCDGGIEMRLTALTLIGALGLAATAVPARAAPVVANLDAHSAFGIVEVRGGCGPGFHPVPGHWSQWRGAWIPPHCAPSYRPYRPYASYHPYWRWHPYH
jgi:hypothetical protein